MSKNEYKIDQHYFDTCRWADKVTFINDKSCYMKKPTLWQRAKAQVKGFFYYAFILLPKQLLEVVNWLTTTIGKVISVKVTLLDFKKDNSIVALCERVDELKGRNSAVAEENFLLRLRNTTLVNTGDFLRQEAVNAGLGDSVAVELWDSVSKATSEADNTQEFQFNCDGLGCCKQQGKEKAAKKAAIKKKKKKKKG